MRFYRILSGKVLRIYYYLSLLAEQRTFFFPESEILYPIHTGPKLEGVLPFLDTYIFFVNIAIYIYI